MGQGSDQSYPAYGNEMARRDRLAMGKSQGLGSQQVGRSSGEILVPVQKRIVAQPDGTTATEVTVDLQDIPIPERRYVAELVALDFRNETVRFMFAQAAVATEQLRSLVVVHVFPEPTRKLLEGSADFRRNLGDFLERNAIPVRSLHEVAEEPTQTVALTANMMSVTFAGREAEWDFFHLPPSAVRKLSERNDVVVDPVVRIDLTTSMAAAILRGLETLQSRLPAEAK
jgi:hypothetical protein